MSQRRVAFMAAIGLITAYCVPLAGAASSAPGPEAVAWGHSPKVIVGRFGSAGGISSVSPAGGAPQVLTTAGGGDGGLAVSPNGRTLLFGASSSIYAIGTSGGSPHKLAAGYDPAWSPSGAQIAYVGSDGVYVMNANGSAAHKIVNDAYTESIGNPAWSPDGKKLAYVACSDPYGSQPCEHQIGFDLYTIGVNGAGKHKVTPKQGMPQCPAWSSKGVLAFLTSDNTTAIVQKNGTLKTYRPSGCPVWSPSGKRLAVGAGAGIALINSDGTGRKQLTILPGSNAGFSSIAWSGDGNWLVAAGGPYPNTHVWVIRATGTGLTKLA